MNECELEFCFKGTRNYVHGTDIFTKLVESYSNVSKVDILFHGVTVKNMRFLTEKPEANEVKVTFKCQCNNEKIKLFGIENDTDVECRYEYLEETIINNSTINISKELIILNNQTQYSFIEHIVAMNKGLLENLFPDAKGKWYFTRLQLKDNIDMKNVSSLQLIMKSNFQFKLTKSAIIVNGLETGFIYFSLVNKES